MKMFLSMLRARNTVPLSGTKLTPCPILPIAGTTGIFCS